jgi:hypothetical protein
MSTQVVEISDGSIVVTTDVGLNGATKQALADEATARANADGALTAAIAAAKADCVLLTGNQSVAGTKTFSSGPLVPTAATGTTTTQAASTAFVQQELGAGVASARALVILVRNQSGSTMTAGTVVYINGATGNLSTIARALGTGDATSAQTIGLVQTSIANNGTGSVVIRGVVSGLDTQALTEGQQLYLSSTVAGGYTTTKQYAPNHLVYVGIVTRSHPTHGSIEVAIQNGYELDEIHDVSAQNPTNGDTLRFNSATGLWEKSALGTAAVLNAGESEGLRFDGSQVASGNGGGAVTSLVIPTTSAISFWAEVTQVVVSSNIFAGTWGSFAFFSASPSYCAIQVSGGAVIAGFSIGLIAGTPTVVVLVRDTAALLWRLYFNGVQVATAPDTGAAIPSSWGSLGGNTTDTGGLGGINGTISRAGLANYALTQAEITALIGRGLVTLPEQRGGSMTALNTGSLIATEVPTSGFLSTSSTAATRNSTADSYWSGYALGLTSKVGQQFRVSMTVTNWQTSSENGVRLGAGIGDPSLSNIYQVTANGAVSFVLTATSNTATHLNFKRVKFDYSGLSIIPLGTLFEQDSGQRNAGYMVRDTSGNGRHLELPETGVSIIDPADTGFIEYTRTTDGYLIGDRRVIPSTGYLVEVVATGNGTVTLGESPGTPANVCASVTLTSTPKILPILVTQTSTGKLYADLGTATTATFKIRHRAV